MGKPFDDAAKDRYLTLIARGTPIALAASQVGVTVSTVKRHLKDDVDFAMAVEDAIQLVDDRVEAVAYDLAVSGDNPASTWKWLERRRRSSWAETKDIHHVVSGPGGGPIQLAEVTTQALRGVLVDDETRSAALQMARELPILEAEVVE